MDATNRARRPKDMLLHEGWSLHRAHPAADAKLALQPHFVQLDSLESLSVFVAYGCNLRRKAIDGDNTLWRCDGRQSLNQTPGRVGYNRAPLRMQIRARAVGPQFQELNAFETEADYRSLLGILVALIPDTTLRGEHLGIVRGKTIEARAPQPVFALDKKS